ncbi:TonB-dependent receptor [Glacieibacterium frigidum]|uniref:TonB-dependent receptor n=1 Tax=Glacieibacterium frigidum TaxID=2593303 RepID=A0A552U9F3_9SPHN|nr:TonB-dependent receptor [Glacieibacterium frigidum]TRW14848.1 TonB-dependent receptor [Glacieibacterium frigidum]
MIHNRFDLRALALAGVALAALTAPATAQTPDTAAPAAAATPDEEIVVTARRRNETLLEVPIAVTAFSGAQLEAAGIQDITQLAQVVPNVTFEPTRGSNTTVAAFIRGVGQQDPVAGFEAGVGIYLDDVYLNRPQASVLDVFDVERIEILRGPQGTLYGRNTIGGAIKYVTKRLSDEAELNVRVTGGMYKEADAIVSGSVPLSSTFRVGGAVARLSRGGFGDNLTLPNRENYNKDVWATRFSAEFDPDPALSLRVTADYVRDDSDPKQGHRLTIGAVSGAPILRDVYDTRSGLDTPEQKVEAYGFSFTAAWKLSDAFTLKNILAYRRDRTDTPIDFDSLPAQDVDVPAIYKNKQTSEELQLLYSSDKLNGLLGFYYLDANAFNIFDVILGTTGAVLGLPGFTASTFGDVDTKTYSFFGDFTYDFTEQFSLSVGGRYTNDKRNSVIIRKNLIGGASPELGGAGVQLGALTSNFNGEATFKEFTPRASISFKPTPDHNLYASYSKGFKGGGFDPRGLSTAAPDTNKNGVRDPNEIYDFLSFDPETVDSYELGYKASLFDRRLSLSIAAFHADYKDVQVPGSFGFDSNGDGINDTFVGVTSNAGKAKIDGLEIEGLARLAPEFAGAGSNVNLGFSFGYIDAKYKQFIGPTGTDVAKQRVFQNTPKYTASLGLTVSVPLSLMGDGIVDIAPALSYKSKTSQFEIAGPLDQKAYTLLDASLVWRSDDDRWSVGVHGKNLTDKRYKTSGYVFGAFNAAGAFVPSLGREGVLTAYYGAPRQVYATVGMKF